MPSGNNRPRGLRRLRISRRKKMVGCVYNALALYEWVCGHHGLMHRKHVPVLVADKSKTPSQQETFRGYMIHRPLESRLEALKVPLNAKFVKYL